MSTLSLRSSSFAAEDGFTLIELLVAMISATVITMAAVSFLIFTTEDVSHISARVNVDQNGRVALQQIMSELHSACVAPNVVPILKESTEDKLQFVSETGEESAFPKVTEHEIVYTPGKNTLTETSHEGTGTAPNYVWSSTAKTRKLLAGVEQTKYGSEAATPVFQYYRYYREGDTLPQGDSTTPFGEFYPASIGANEKEAPYITKVKVSFTVAPEVREQGVSFNHDRPVALEDSATFRLAPASETIDNLPCAEKT
jgi:Tfp pilus assembly protein PilW